MEDDEDQNPTLTPPAVTPAAPKVSVTSHSGPSAAPSGATGLESRILERIEMYKTAISNAKAAGETSKVRRHDRGLKVNKEETLHKTHKLIPIFCFHLHVLNFMNLTFYVNGRLYLVYLFPAIAKTFLCPSTLDIAVDVNICKERKSSQ